MSNSRLGYLDAKREEFRRYLEQSGVMDAFTKVLVGLYEEPERPKDALEYVKKHLGDDRPEVVEYESIKAELEEYKARLQLLESENEELKRRLGDFQPESALNELQPERAGSTLEPERAGSTLQPERARSTLEPERAGSTLEPERARSTLEPERARSTLEPERARSTLEPERARSTLEPERARSTVEPETDKEPVKEELANE